MSTVMGEIRWNAQRCATRTHGLYNCISFNGLWAPNPRSKAHLHPTLVPCLACCRLSYGGKEENSPGRLGRDRGRIGEEGRGSEPWAELCPKSSRFSRIFCLFLFYYLFFIFFIFYFHYFAHSQLFDLEERRRAKMHDLAVTIQKIYRGWTARTRVSTAAMGLSSYESYGRLWDVRKAWPYMGLTWCAGLRQPEASWTSTGVHLMRCFLFHATSIARCGKVKSSLPSTSEVSG